METSKGKSETFRQQTECHDACRAFWFGWCFELCMDMFWILTNARPRIARFLAIFEKCPLSLAHPLPLGALPRFQLARTKAFGEKS